MWRQWQALAAFFEPAAELPSAAFARSGEAAFGPFLEATERFTGAAKRFLESAVNASAPAAAEAARGFSDFLRDQFAGTFRPPGYPGMTGAANGAAAAFIEGLPALGLTREHQQRAQRAAEAWRRIESAQLTLQRLWSDALREAAAAFAARLRPPPQPSALGEEALHGLYDTWIDCAEEAYARTAHGDAFCSALAELVNAGSQWRRELRESAEQWAKLLDLPTRGEVSTLAQRLKAVEEQLRAARRSARAPRAPRAAVRKPGRRRKPKP